MRPSGDKYLMEDFYYAGGLRALLSELKDLLHLEARTVNGRTLGENIADAKIYNDDVIRTHEATRSRRRAGWSCCAATSRPTAR